MFLLFRGIYTYPLRKTAIAFGAASIVFSFIYTTYVIVLQLNYIKKREINPELYPDGYVLVNDDDFHPIVYKTTTGLILGSIQGYLLSAASALVIYGAVHRKRFLLLPYVSLQCLSMVLTICWFIACFAIKDFHKYDMMWFGIIFMQVQLTYSIFRHFQELSDAISIPTAVDSPLPYGKMANAI